MLQIFVNLERERQNAAPFALSLEPQDVPVVQLPGAKVRVPLGRFGEVHSPLLPPTEVGLLDISLAACAELIVPVKAGHTAFVMPIFGTLMVDGQRFEIDELRIPIFPAQTEPRILTFQANQDNTKAGTVCRTTTASTSSLARTDGLASTEALATAVAAYRRGELGSL